MPVSQNGVQRIPLALRPGIHGLHLVEIRIAAPAGTSGEVRLLRSDLARHRLVRPLARRGSALTFLGWIAEETTAIEVMTVPAAENPARLRRVGLVEIGLRSLLRPRQLASVLATAATGNRGGALFRFARLLDSFHMQIGSTGAAPGPATVATPMVMAYGPGRELEAPVGEGIVVLVPDGAPVDSGQLTGLAASFAGEPAAVCAFCDEEPLAPGAPAGLALKPCWSPSAFLSGLVRTPVVAVRLSAWRDAALGPLGGPLAAELVVAALARRYGGVAVLHCPDIRTGRAIASDPIARARAIATILYDAMPDTVSAEAGCLPRFHSARPEESERVVVVIPTRDRADLLSRCMDGLLHGTSHRNVEVIIVDHDSREPSALDLLRRLETDPRIRRHRVTGPFNFSRFINEGAALAEAPFVLLLNNDIEMIDPAWLDALLAEAAAPDVAVVGAHLAYPTGQLQHAGVITGAGVVARHAFYNLRPDDRAYQPWLRAPRDVSAVTAAAMLVRRSAFDAVGGFDTNLAVAYNDVDFCLKVRRAGWRVIVTPSARLVHHESVSRGRDRAPSRREAHAAEMRLMLDRWGDELAADPHFNPHLSIDAEGFVPLHAAWPTKSRPGVGRFDGQPS